MRKLIIIHLFVGYLFGLHGKITFFDGTYVVGRVTKVDESTVYIIPMGLDTAEGILVGNIDTLRMENGLVPVVSSSVKYFYEKGEFLANNDDWMDEFDDFKYDDYTTQKEEYKYEESKKLSTAYNSVTVYGGMPFAFRSLQDSLKTTKLAPNLGLVIQAPYFPVGAVDISPGLKIMTFGFDNPDMGVVNAIQLSGNMSVDFKPVFFFLPKALHLCMDLGINYNIAFKHEPSAYALSHSDYDGEANYGGIGFSTGASMDYWFTELPLALRLFGNTNIIPQGEPYPELKTGFISVGAMLVVVMKRHR